MLKVLMNVKEKGVVLRVYSLMVDNGPKSQNLSVVWAMSLFALAGVFARKVMVFVETS